MQEREFTVHMAHLESELFYSVDDAYAQEICNNDLEIPQECIKKIECYDDAFKIYLTKSKRYYRDDWYVNLIRLDYVS